MGTGPVPSISSLMSGALFSWREPGVRPVSRLFGVTEAWVQRLGTSAHPPSCGEAAPGLVSPQPVDKGNPPGFRGDGL